MKNQFFVLFLSFFGFINAQAADTLACLLAGNSCNHYGDSIIEACAPEVKNGNIAATDRVLTELANAELKDAKKFKGLIGQLKKQDSAKRLSGYLALVGVESDTELVAFVGAREIEQKYIDTLARNTDLSNNEARLVIERISQSLLGERK